MPTPNSFIFNHDRWFINQKVSKMRTTLLAIALAIPGLGTFTAASAEDTTTDAEESGGINVGEQLPPKVRGLLIEEMQGILAASQEIQAAIVQGDHETVAQEAQAIHDSFIMEQEMTEEDEQALLAAVPDEFLEQDQALHKLSETLAEAGRDQNTALQLQQFNELMEGCVRCHGDYASARFPDL